MPTINRDDIYKKLLIPFSFIIFCLVAYVFYPKSFEEAWKGRVFYLFFLWLFTLEFILGGRPPKPRHTHNSEWAKVVIGTFFLMIPTIYIIEVRMFELDKTVLEIGKFLGLPQNWQLYDHWPISLEYIVVAVSVFMAVVVLLNLEGIKQFSVSIFLLGMMGLFFTIDTFRPYATATFTPLPPFSPFQTFSIQGFVPFTSSFVTFILQKLDYAVQMLVLKQTGGVQIIVNNIGFLVFWPCAGVHSLFIYTFVIFLFLKDSPMSWIGKAACFIIGAVGTFFVNVLRIVTIIDVYVTSGAQAGDYFHKYYGELYFLGWITIFLFSLVFIHYFLTNTRSRAFASAILFWLGLVIFLSPRFFFFQLKSTQLIASIAGVVLITASLILAIYTYFAYKIGKTNKSV